MNEANSHVYTSVLRVCIFQLQILEAEGMLVPDELSCILQLVSEHLREPCPITSLSGTQGPAHHEGPVHPAGNGRKTSGRRQAQQVNTTRPERSRTLLWWRPSLSNFHQGSNARQDSGSECCLSLCQAVSFLPAADEDEEMMVRKEDGSGRGTDIWLPIISFPVSTSGPLGNALSSSLSGEGNPGREKTLAVLTVSDFECPLCIRSVMRRCRRPLVKVQPTHTRQNRLSLLYVPILSLSSEGYFSSQ